MRMRALMAGRYPRCRRPDRRSQAVLNRLSPCSRAVSTLQRRTIGTWNATPTHPVRSTSRQHPRGRRPVEPRRIRRRRAFRPAPRPARRHRSMSSPADRRHTRRVVARWPWPPAGSWSPASPAAPATWVAGSAVAWVDSTPRPTDGVALAPVSYTAAAIDVAAVLDAVEASVVSIDTIVEYGRGPFQRRRRRRRHRRGVRRHVGLRHHQRARRRRRHQHHRDRRRRPAAALPPSSPPTPPTTSPCCRWPTPRGWSPHRSARRATSPSVTPSSPSATPWRWKAA